MEFPLYIGSKKENMPKELHEVKMHAQDFQESIPKYKEKNQVKRIPNGEIITWKISLKDTSRNEISIGTHKERCQTPKGEDGSKQTNLSTKFHVGTKYQKKRLAIHQHTLNMDHKMSVL